MRRAGKDQSKRFAELAAAIRALPPATLILDGEMAIYDRQLVCRLERVRHDAPDGLVTKICSPVEPAETPAVSIPCRDDALRLA